MSTRKKKQRDSTSRFPSNKNMQNFFSTTSLILAAGNLPSPQKLILSCTATVENKWPNLEQDEVEVAANGLKKSSQKLLDKFIRFESAVCSFFSQGYCRKGIHCEFAHENIIPGYELEWDDHECTGCIITAKVVSIKENTFGRKRIHFTYI